MIPYLLCFAVWAIDGARVQRGHATLTASTDSTCPEARFDADSNRYLVTPVTTPTRAKFELRKLPASGDPCSGELFINRTISFQAVHYSAKGQQWHGVLDTPIEVDDEASKSNAIGSTIDSSNGNPAFALCYPGSNLPSNMTSSSCVALLGVPPLPSMLEKVGVWVPRHLSTKINTYIWAIFIVLICYIVAVVAILLAVPILVRSCFGDKENVSEEETGGAAPGEVPQTKDIILEVAIELGRMAAGVATLLLVTFFFVVRRQMTQFNMCVLTGFPILLVIVHMIIVLSTMNRVLLYYAGLDCKIHICFTPRRPMYLSPMWIILILAILLYAFAVIHTLLSDVNLSGDEPITLTTVAVKTWALLFPAAYCLILIFNDEKLELKLVTLYAIIAEGEGNDDPEQAPRFLGSLRPVKEADFLKAGDAIYKTGGIEVITARTVADKCANLDHSDAPISVVQAVTTWFSTSYWTWKVRLSRSKHRMSSLWKLAIVVVSAIAFMTIFLLAALLYSNTLFPTLTSVTPTLGQMSPAFDPHVFDYVIFVDKKVKGCAFEILTNQDLVATTEMRLPNVKSKSIEAWTNATHTSYVPFLARPPTAETETDQDGNGVIEKGEGQSRILKASKQQAVPIEFIARGAGTSITYRFTVIKLEPRVTALEYKYNTSSRVDEVTVLKQIDWQRVTPAEDTESEDGEMASVDGEGVAIYVPEDTTSVFIDLHREIQIYGPAGAVLRGNDLNWFDAVSSVNLGKPQQKSKKQGTNESAPEGFFSQDTDSNSSDTSTTSGNVDLDDEEDLTAVPVQLSPNGTDPFVFHVSIVKVSNRLVNLAFEVARDGADSSGWKTSPPLPAFRPVVNEYEAFFEVPFVEKSETSAPPSPSPMSTLQLDNSEKKETVFFRIQPQGDARVNWVKVELVPDSPEQDLEPFCRPAGDEFQPLDPSVSEKTSDLACGIPAEEAEEAEEGEATEDLVIQANGRNFTGHFFVKYSFVPGESLPFTVRLYVMFHDENPALVGNRSNTSNVSDQHSHSYSINFLPQKPMRLDLKLPIRGPPSSYFAMGSAKQSTPTSAPASAAALPALLDAMDSPVEDTLSIRLPVFLSEPYRSDVFEYSATLPQGVEGALDVTLGQFHSFWAGLKGDNAPLEGPGWSSDVNQHFTLRRGECSTEEPRRNPGPAAALPASPASSPVSFVSANSAPAPASTVPASPASAANVCPLSIVAYERKDGFPHTYVIKLREASKDEVLFIGSLLPDGTAREVFGFRPHKHEFVAPHLGLILNWVSPELQAPSPAPATAPAVSGTSLAAVPAPSTSSASVLPVASLAVLQASASDHLEAFWNGGMLPILHSGMDAWRSITFHGKVLAEICWCEREQPGPSCQTDLRIAAPQLFDLSQPNKCTFELKSANRTLYKIEVGEGSTTRTTREDMTAAAEEAEAVSGKASGSPSAAPAAAPTAHSVALLQRPKDYVEAPWNLFRRTAIT